jgi:integrase
MMTMAKIDVPYVQSFKDKHGRQRYYLRKRGFARVPLPGDPGSVAFAEAYETALQAGLAPGVNKNEGPRSLGALIAKYYSTQGFADKAETTRRSYRHVLENLRNECGWVNVSAFTPDMLTLRWKQMAKTPAQASNLRKRLTAVFDVAIDEGWLKVNPVPLSKKVRYKTKGFTPWTEEDIEAYRKRWPSASRERLALELLLHTGVRRSDVVKIGRQHIRDGFMYIVQTKNGKPGRPIKLPVHPELQREIAAAPLGMTFLLTQYGEPFTKHGFSQWLRERAEMAGLKGKTPHGLRKATGRRLAEAGCSEKEIAAFLGHGSPATAAVYTRDAEQGKMASAAMTKLREVSNP